MTQQRQRRWLVAVAIVGVMASAVATGIVWLVMTRPVEVAQALGRVF